VGSETPGRVMLQELADTARAVFGARAVSILVADADGGELEFVAVSGEGADTTPGRRISAARGIAGWVLEAGRPLVVEDVLQDPRFAAGFARSTGYVPKAIMAAPIPGEERPRGVMNVLDRARRPTRNLIEVDLLERFCRLASLALDAVGDA
jgi:GAF domain-containing protein